MKTDDLKQLVEKFFDGETTVEEEKVLRAYFAKENVPRQFVDVKSYFMALEKESEPVLEEDFDQHLFEKMEGDTTRERKIKQWAYSIMATAAAVLLLLWIGTKVSSNQLPYGTINDPALAFNEARKALDMTAVEMNKGLLPAEKTVNTIDKNLQLIYQLEKWPMALEKTSRLFQKTNQILPN